MRLDSVGRPPNLQNDSGQDVPQLDKLKVESVKGVAEISSGKDSGQQSLNDNPRLGKILSLIVDAQEKKKKSDLAKRKGASIGKAIKAYEQANQDESPVAHLGQAIDRII